MKRAFEQFILERSSGEFIERDWLKGRIDRALAAPDVNLVLITGEPGTGKTSLMAGMAKAHPDWLRYFVGGETGGAPATGDLSSFLLAIGHQLAHQQPMLFEPSVLEVAVQQHVDSIEAQGSATGVRIEDLSASPFYRTARLTVEQQVGNLSGTLTGVEIGTAHLEPRLLEPDNLAHLALLGPADVLSETDPEGAGIVVLLDALDEASRANRDTELLEWLATGPRLPDNVKIVVTSRPQSALGLLRAGRADQMEEILLDPGDHQVADDLVAYAEKTLTTAEVTRAAQARQLFPDQFLRQAARRADGNFLYLASYVRALKDAIDSDDVELVDRLFKLEDLPGTLSGIYGFLVELARVEIDRLGLLDIQDPVSPADRYTPAWEGVGQPILGVLTVAREPLTEDQLMKLAGARVWPRSVRNVLARLRWLLYRRGERVALFHASAGEFLTGPLAREKHPDCWLDPVEWNERIARHYRGPAATWAKVDWPKMDRYGLTYLSEHILRAESRTSEQAIDLICSGFLEAVRAEFGVARPFLDAVDQIAHHVIQTGNVKNGLAPLIYLGVVRNQAVRRSRAVPARVLGLMAQVGRLNEALERTAELAPSFHQFAAMVEIAHYAECRPGEPTREDLNERAVEYALMVPPSADIYDAKHALEFAARILAPYDLERALRLWERREEDRRLAGKNGTEAPDCLYRRAAAAERDPAEARALIGRLSKDRFSAYLDLAGRVTEPAQIRDILKDAEKSLAGSGPTVRIRGLAELARNWHALDRESTARLIAELRAELFQVGEVKEWTENFAPALPQSLVDAARAIESVDPSTARMLLTRLDLDSEVTNEAFISAAVLWTSWGAKQRALAVADRLSGRDRDGWSQYALKTALGELSPESALESLEGRLAATLYPGAVAHTSEGQLRTIALIPVVAGFAKYDLARAAQIARQAPETAWYWGGYRPFPWLGSDGRDTEQTEEIYANDRYSMLAGIAHLHLDRGERAEATAILEEALAFYSENAEQLATTDDSGAMPMYKQTASEAEEQQLAASEGLTHGELTGAGAAFNAIEDWQGFVKRHFFRDPADIVRAASTSSGSLAKTLRVAAEQLWSRDRVAAARIVRALDDAGERAIGLSALHWDSHNPDHGPDSERLSRELDQALAQLASYRWTSSRWPSSERRATAYARPDIRARFEVALCTLGCRKQDASGVEDLEYLSMASKLHRYLFLVDHYITDLLEREHFPVGMRELLTQALSPSWFQGQQREHLIDCTRAAIAYREFRIIRDLPGYAPIEDRVKIENPIYATAMDLVAPTSDGALSPAFAVGIRRLLAHGRIAAATGLLAFAAEIRPEAGPALLPLAEETIAACKGNDPVDRVDALVYLAAAPILAELLDPAVLLDEAERARAAAWGNHHLIDRAVARLFPVLLQRNPSLAMRAFYQAASTRWSHSMSLLENAVGQLRVSFGSEFADRVARPVQQGLACVAADGTPPETADGVSLTGLLSVRPAEAPR